MMFPEFKMEKTLRIALVVSEWNKEITEALSGSQKHIDKSQCLK